MLEAILSGVLYGLLLSLLIGPVFFALLQTSVDKGFREGALMAFGIVLSDTICILVAYLGISQFMANDFFKTWMGVAGGIILVAFGVFTFFKNTKPKEEQHDLSKRKGTFRFIIKGFLLNGINPFVFIYWIGIVSFITLSGEYNRYETIGFFFGVAITVFGTDLLKAFLAHKLRHFITEKFQHTLNRLVGTGLFIFGLRLIFLTFTGEV